MRRTLAAVGFSLAVVLLAGVTYGGGKFGNARLGGGVVTAPILLATTVTDDLAISSNDLGQPGINDPTLASYQPAGSGATFSVLAFAKTPDEVYAQVQLPHRYKAGTDLLIHIHWTPRDQGNEESGNTVGWKIDYSATDIGSTFPASGTADLSDACNGVDHEHNTTPNGTITGTSLSESAIILLRIYRSDTGADDTWTGAAAGTLPVLLSVDLHYEVEKLGS